MYVDNLGGCGACEQHAHPNKPDGHPEPIRSRYEFYPWEGRGSEQAETEKPSKVVDKHGRRASG